MKHISASALYNDNKNSYQSNFLGNTLKVIADFINEMSRKPDLKWATIHDNSTGEVLKRIYTIKTEQSVIIDAIISQTDKSSLSVMLVDNPRPHTRLVITRSALEMFCNELEKEQQSSVHVKDAIENIKNEIAKSVPDKITVYCLVNI
jgi:hypothetical protein